MIYAFIRSFLGDFGRAVMDFYIQNSLWINTLLLGYALLVVIAHRNYFIALEKIFTHMRTSNEKFTQEGIIKLTGNDHKKINWEEIRKSIKFPLISEPRSWGIKWINSSYLQREFTMEKLNQFLKIARIKEG